MLRSLIADPLGLSTPNARRESRHGYLGVTRDRAGLFHYGTCAPGRTWCPLRHTAAPLNPNRDHGLRRDHGLPRSTTLEDLVVTTDRPTKSMITPKSMITRVG